MWEGGKKQKKKHFKEKRGPRNLYEGVTDLFLFLPSDKKEGADLDEIRNVQRK